MKFLYHSGSPGLFTAVLLITALFSASCTNQTEHTLVTIADARTHPAIFIKSNVNQVDTNQAGTNRDQAGDILVFNQPLLNGKYQPIGNNSGSCIRTRPGKSFQCQWTLSFKHGTIQVAGREFDKGTSAIAIVGGTGKFSTIRGEITSKNNGDGTFTQTLIYQLNH